MRCRQARKILVLLEGATETGRRSATEHLSVCRECSEFYDQLCRVWSALEQYPSIEPSPDFAQKLHRRLEAPKSRSSSIPYWRPVMGWQWMGLAACVLMVGFLLAVRPPLYPPPAEVGPSKEDMSKADMLDEKLLLELEESLDRSKANYLPAYDSWPANYLQTFPENTQGGKPAEEGALRRVGA